MSTPESKIAPKAALISKPVADERRRAWGAIASTALLIVLGYALCFRPQWYSLWQMWTNDPLRSIGMVIPLASLAFAIRAWRVEDFASEGSWWGLALALVTAALAMLALSPAFYPFVPAPGQDYVNIHVIPTGFLVSGYASGVVLLFGGTRAWRRGWFPLLLLIAVNPVPGFFNGLVDLPLQYFAAHMARGFADFMGVPVSEGTLRMMFTPRLGMFIAPGCDGLRGAVAMGYLALIIGYFYRLRWMRWGAYVVAAIMLAYAFNLLRLGSVVVYYWCAIRIPAIADHGTLVDYFIGGTLFFFAALFLFSIPRWWREKSCTSS